MPEVLVRGLLVGAGELVGERLGADAVVARDEVVVGDGGAARLDGPHRLA